ncbi:hypothetical protein [Kineothrix sedimenti]|uniref:Calcineurin-like phosphoesterase family protein n=1 Tax=Kineothrix sedimenti TaxID=3123317 RepID=A0ABZ3F020_9FIRM
MVNTIHNNEFLREQLDLLKRRQTDEGVEWQDITDFRSNNLGDSEHRDTIRKGSKLLYEYLDAGWINEPIKDNSSSTIDFGSPSDKISIQKERIKAQTERLETNKWIRELSRDELVTQHIVEAINNITPLEIPEFNGMQISNRVGVLCFGDEHFGAEFELYGLHGEVINSYNPEIFIRRMWDLQHQVINIINKENLDEIRIFSMGDFSDGILRVSQLLKLRYGIVEGTVLYAEFICNWLNELSKYVNIKFQMVKGNHTELRLIGQPKGTFTNENMDLVVRAMIKARLVDNPNFELIENPTGMIYDEIFGFNFLGIHGEVKSMERAIKDFSHTYNTKISYLIAGHLHHSKSETIGVNCEVINVPSVIGVDDYSLSLNKTSNAGATMLIIEEDRGKTIEYSIKLN